MLFFLIVLIDEPFDFKQMFCAFLDLFRAEFEFDERISSVVQAEDAIGFQAIAVAVIAHIAVEGGRVDFQIADAQRFKQESKSLEICIKVLRVQPHSGDGNGRINQVAFFGRADGSL